MEKQWYHIPRRQLPPCRSGRRTVLAARHHAHHRRTLGELVNVSGRWTMTLLTSWTRQEIWNAGRGFSSSTLRSRIACEWPAQVAMKRLEDRNYALCILCHIFTTSYQFNYLWKGCILVTAVCCQPLPKHFGKMAKELVSSIWELTFGLKSERWFLKGNSRNNLNG